MPSYAVVLDGDMVGRTLELPSGCRILERNESKEVLEDEGGPAVIIECEDDNVDLLSIPGVRTIEPL
jgi:hypothetical protein